jgi:hypothetical protein
MPYMNADGTVHVVLPSADQVHRPTFAAPAWIEIGGAAVAAALGIVMQPRIAVIVLAAAMLPYGVAVVAHAGRVVRGLHGGDEGAVTAGAVAQLVVPLIGIALAAAGSSMAAVIVVAGGMMLVATGQALLGPSPHQAATAAVGAVLLSSIGFATGLSAAASHQRVLVALAIVASSAALAAGACVATPGLRKEDI